MDMVKLAISSSFLTLALALVFGFNVYVDGVTAYALTLLAFTSISLGVTLGIYQMRD